MNQEDMELMAAILNEPLTDVQKVQRASIMDAVLHGTGAYTLAMDIGRGQSKSVLANMALHRTISGRITGQQANMAFIDDHEPRSKTMHVFHHKRGYIEIPDGSPSKAPNHCYFLWHRQWYKKTSETKVRAIPVSKVPKEHRLFLMVSDIDQPKE